MKTNWLVFFIKNLKIQFNKKDTDINELACILDYAFGSFSNPIIKTNNIFECKDENGISMKGYVENVGKISNIFLENEEKLINLVTSKNNLFINIEKKGSSKKSFDHDIETLRYFDHELEYKVKQYNNSVGSVPENVELIKIKRTLDLPTIMYLGKEILTRQIYTSGIEVDNELPLTFIALNSKKEKDITLINNKSHKLIKSMEI